MSEFKSWTSESSDSYVYQIATNFVVQLEEKMAATGTTQSELAQRLGKKESFVSRIINNPGNLTLRSMVEFAKALEMGVSVVAYNRDPDLAPIGAEIFKECWQVFGYPTEVLDAGAKAEGAFVQAESGTPTHMVLGIVNLERQETTATPQRR